MRIAHICGFGWQPKGTVRFRAFPLAAALVAAGHEVTIFLTPYDHREDEGKEYRHEGVRVANMLLGKAPILRHISACYSLCRETIRYDPDVIHVFKPKGYAGAALTYLMATGRRRLVLDCDDWEGWGGWNDVKAYPRVVKEWIDLQEKWLIRHSPCVTVASRVLEARAVELRRSSAKVFYLPNAGTSAGGREIRDRVLAMDPEGIRKSFGLPSGDLILYAGHFEAADNGMFFSRAAASVAREWGATILIVGDGPELPAVRDFFSAQQGVDARFFGSLPYEKFLALVCIADIAAYPYRDDAIHRAKCSARIIDYMAMGRAVVTTAVGENNEYLRDGLRGILVPPDDEVGFGLALTTLLRDRNLRSFLGENARRYVEESLWSSHTSIDTCLAAYTAALSANESSPRVARREQVRPW